MLQWPLLVLGEGSAASWESAGEKILDLWIYFALLEENYNKWTSKTGLCKYKLVRRNQILVPYVYWLKIFVFLENAEDQWQPKL